MNTLFERNRAQISCETFIPDAFSPKQADFKNFTLSTSQVSILAADLIEDSKDYYFKGILSLFEALKSVESGLFSWATIKLYYSVYYLLRCTMALNQTAIVRNRSLYCLKIANGEKPIGKSNKKYNSDHSGTINYFIDTYSAFDPLMTQDVDDTNVYDWLMKRREQINYRERIFHEPNHSDFWEKIALARQSGQLENLIRDYINDPYILCFQEENAVLAVPLKRAVLTKEKFDKLQINIGISVEQKKLLSSMLPFNIAEIKSLAN